MPHVCGFSKLSRAPEDSFQFVCLCVDNWDGNRFVQISIQHGHPKVERKTNTINIVVALLKTNYE